MNDKWINSGYDGEELKPHTEPLEDHNDASRIGEILPSLTPLYSLPTYCMHPKWHRFPYLVHWPLVVLVHYCRE